LGVKGPSLRKSPSRLPRKGTSLRAGKEKYHKANPVFVSNQKKVEKTEAESQHEGRRSRKKRNKAWKEKARVDVLPIGRGREGYSDFPSSGWNCKQNATERREEQSFTEDAVIGDRRNNTKGGGREVTEKRAVKDVKKGKEKKGENIPGWSLGYPNH